MRIQTARLILRPIENADMEQMLVLLTDEMIKKTYMIPDFASREEAIRLAERFAALSHDASRVVVGIVREEKIIGFINDVGIEDGEIELGYALHPEYHGQGLMTEALGALINQLFESGYHRVVAGAFESNEASLRVMEKCGMQKMEKTDRIAYRGQEHTCLYRVIEREK